MNKKILGHRLKELRKAKGLSQSELAKILGYKNHSTLAKVETGVNDIAIETLYKYAAALDVNVFEILSFDSKPDISNIQELKKLLKYIEKEQANGVKYYSIDELDLALKQIIKNSGE